MESYLRSERFTAPPMSLDEATAPTKREQFTNPHFSKSKAELESLMLAKQQWRHHHDLPFLKEPSEAKTLYSTYAKRVDTMLRMAEAGMRMADIDPALKDKTACDLACAEGFTANHFLDKGAEHVDGYEINLDGVDRLHLVRAYKEQHNGDVYRLDLASPTWAKAVPQYDVVFCLGILYHMENPMLFMRNVFAATKDVCILETDTPLTLGDGGALAQVSQQVWLSPGNVRPLLELRPNRRATVDMMLSAGFTQVWVVDPPADGECRYLKSGSKSVFVGRR